MAPVHHPSPRRFDFGRARSKVSRGILLGAVLLQTGLQAADWPMRGRDNTRNPVSQEKNPPVAWDVGWEPGRAQAAAGAKARPPSGLRWQARLGSMSHGDPVVADGLVWVGTNNEGRRDPSHAEEGAVLMCLREGDGEFLYQYLTPRLETGKQHDWEYGSLASSPLVDGDLIFFCTNRAEVVCLDIAPLKTPEDAGAPRVVWKLDMMKELGVIPDAAMIPTSGLHCSPASWQDMIYVNTTNGRTLRPPPWRKGAPAAPSLLCLEKHTGRIVWQDSSPGGNIIDLQQGSPLVVEIQGRAQCIMGQGDGWLRSFDALTGELLWKFDINFKDAVPFDTVHSGVAARTGAHEQAYMMSIPVYHEGRVYMACATDPELVAGAGRLVCLDPLRRGDISSELASAEPGGRAAPNPNSGLLWEYVKAPAGTMAHALHKVREENRKAVLMHFSFSEAVISRGLLVITDEAGLLHCLDAATGAHHWSFDSNARGLCAPLVADGRIFMPVDEGELFILPLGAKLDVKEIITHEFPDPLYSTPVFANGTLYVLGLRKLHAIGP